jgi:hypothetical protein
MVSGPPAGIGDTDAFDWAARFAIRERTPLGNELWMRFALPTDRP